MSEEKKVTIPDIGGATAVDVIEIWSKKPNHHQRNTTGHP